MFSSECSSSLCLGFERFWLARLGWARLTDNNVSLGSNVLTLFETICHLFINLEHKILEIYTKVQLLNPVYLLSGQGDCSGTLLSVVSYALDSSVSG